MISAQVVAVLIVGDAVVLLVVLRFRAPPACSGLGNTGGTSAPTSSRLYLDDGGQLCAFVGEEDQRPKFVHERRRLSLSEEGTKWRVVVQPEAKLCGVVG